MKLWSDAWPDGAAIPERYAAGRRDGASVGFAPDVSPPLAWSDVPAATRSFALVCHDPDVPSRGDDVNRSGREIPSSLARIDFFHWVLADIAASVSALPEAAFGDGFVARGKAGPAVSAAGFAGARHGINDYTGWFAGDPSMAGDYYGYDGPFPPWNDSIVHHYVFTLFALDIVRAAVDGRFAGGDLRAAIAGHVLAEATLTGTYSLNPRLVP